MTKETTNTGTIITRERMIELLNEDLAGEYQAIIAYTVYSQVSEGGAITPTMRANIEVHASGRTGHMP